MDWGSSRFVGAGGRCLARWIYVALTFLYLSVPSTSAWAGARTGQPREPVFSLMDYVGEENLTRNPVDDGKAVFTVPSRGVADPSAQTSTGRGWNVVSNDVPYGSARAPQTAPDADAAPRGSFSLNLIDATIQEASEAVLGDIFKVNYTIDPKIEGRISLRTTTPVDRKGIAELFESALRSANAALVRNGNVYRVVPAEQGTMGASVRLARDGGDTLGRGVKVVPLRFVSAAEMKRLLEPVTSFGGVVRIDATRNALMLSGTDQEIAALREAIGVFDVNVLRGVSSSLVPVRALDPEEVAENLTRAFATGGEGAMSGMVQLIPNKRLKSVLVISRQPKYLAAAKAWILRMDRAAGGPAKQFFTYVVRNRQAKDLVEVLNAMFSDETGANEVRTPRPSRLPVDAALPVNVADTGAQGFAVSGGAIGGGQVPSGLGSIPSQAGLGGTAIDRLQDFSNRGETAAAVQATRIGTGADGEPRMKIVADTGQNALLILASEPDYKRVERVLAALDVIPSQVLIEATIAEVTLNDDLRFGVRWFLDNHSGSRQAAFSDLLSGAVGSAFPGFSFVAKTINNTQVTLNALDQVSRVHVLASPRLMVLDKKTATLQIGNEVPITTQSAQSVLTPGAPVVNSIAYKDTGVILAVTPKINESGRIVLEIEQEVSTVSRTDTSNIDSPTFGRRKVHTSVVVNDGENLTLGGLIQDRTTHVETQVPVLGDLPIIGNAFKDKTDSIEKTELIIMLTPRVVRDLNEARAVTNEYRSKIESLIPSHEPFHRAVRNLKRVIE